MFYIAADRYLRTSKHKLSLTLEIMGIKFIVSLLSLPPRMVFYWRFCGARKSGAGDWSAVDIVMRRSTDAGKTWTPMQTLAYDNGLPCNNATPIVDFETGEVHLLYYINFDSCYFYFTKIKKV